MGFKWNSPQFSKGNFNGTGTLNPRVFGCSCPAPTYYKVNTQGPDRASCEAQRCEVESQAAPQALPILHLFLLITASHPPGCGVGLGTAIQNARLHGNFPERITQGIILSKCQVFVLIKYHKFSGWKQRKFIIWQP